MARFITLHREILREGTVVVDVHVNVENITYVTTPFGKSKFTEVHLVSGFVEVIESPDTVARLISDALGRR